MDSVKPRVLATGRYAIDVEPIPPRNRNNKEVHLDYLKHLKESVETLCEIVEEAKVERPLDRVGTFSSAILSAQGYQQRQADMTYILVLDENIDMLRLIIVRLRQRWSRKSDENIQVNKSRIGVNEVIVPLDWALRGYWD
ncbi:hypothetical protein Tco_1177176 [Tanacetum coccineum]